MKNQHNKSAINLLERQKNKIAGLLSSYNASAFMGWKQETENIIDNIFKEDSRHIKNFKKALKIRTIPSNIQHNGRDAEEKRIYNTQLKNANESLRVIIENINEFGLPGSLKGISTDLKIFISHAHKDTAYAEEIIRLLNDIGIKKDRKLIFCSSVHGYDIPLRKNIYEYLKREFTEKNLFVIFLLSENYYNSPACLNEMGATWVLSRNYQTVLLPGFQYHNIRGAINPMEICIKLDEKGLEFKLNEFKDLIISEFELPSVDQNIWESDRNKFIKQIKSVASKKKVLKIPVNNKQLQQQVGNPPKQTQTIQDFAKNRLKQQASLTQMSIIFNERMKEFDKYLGEQIAIIENLFSHTSTECTYLLDILEDMDPKNFFGAHTYGDIQLDFDRLPKRFVYHRTINLDRYGNIYDASLKLDILSEITPYEFSIEVKFPSHSDYAPHLRKGKSIDFPSIQELHEWIDNTFSTIQEILNSRYLKQEVTQK
jgi:hypothetical protein